MWKNTLKSYNILHSNINQFHTFENDQDKTSIVKSKQSESPKIHTSTFRYHDSSRDPRNRVRVERPSSISISPADVYTSLQEHQPEVVFPLLLDLPGPSNIKDLDEVSNLADGNEDEHIRTLLKAKRMLEDWKKSIKDHDALRSSHTAENGQTSPLLNRVDVSTPLENECNEDSDEYGSLNDSSNHIDSISPPHWLFDLSTPPLTSSPTSFDLSSHNHIFHDNDSMEPLRLFAHRCNQSLPEDIEAWGGVLESQVEKAHILLLPRTSNSKSDLIPKNGKEVQIIQQAFMRDQRVLASSWVDHCIEQEQLLPVDEYCIWLSEMTIYKRRPAAIRADERRHELERDSSIFIPREQEQEHDDWLKEEGAKPWVLELGSELGSEEEFDGNGEIRKIIFDPT
ncbi:uncharacterized protein I206_106260 [Kwoniella pini CBS 10737]|uniref:BRCT domain-containing protein n=1 Tax=Kwoniella pini CBS 10737 TaxID=1296096 RepID=A0A1B9I1H8_9TREE|nr:uncharacterized protein I206_05086 [Kwoniella pini CBS 10737]OCF49393.1 hypothetical protein I206_05086 [Kwoniella pini CBS 10737]